MRIIAGTARGKPLRGPRHAGIRPTSDRVREALFNILGQYLEPLRVLDLFAGSGALALEALSRGAEHAVLVDSSRESLALCRTNAEALGFEGRVEVVAGEIDPPLLRRLAARGPFGIVFADPPYAAFHPDALLGAIDDARLLSPGATIVLEHDKRAALPSAVRAIRLEETRRFGDTCLSFYSTRPHDQGPLMP